ncbi:MAG: GtrA family protein [Pseudomonadota bacterium]
MNRSLKARTMRLRQGCVQQFRRALSPVFLKYFGVSVLALLLDTLIFLSLSLWLHYLLAATLGFLSGAVLHYVLSVSCVFTRRRLRAKRWAESLLFVVFGGLGLLVNLLLLTLCVAWLALPLLGAKLVAAGGSFLASYLLRKGLLF